MNYYELLKKYRRQKDKIKKLEAENEVLSKNHEKYLNLMKLYQLGKMLGNHD